MTSLTTEEAAEYKQMKENAKDDHELQELFLKISMSVENKQTDWDEYWRQSVLSDLKRWSQRRLASYTTPKIERAKKLLEDHGFHFLFMEHDYPDVPGGKLYSLKVRHKDDNEERDDGLRALRRLQKEEDSKKDLSFLTPEDQAKYREQKALSARRYDYESGDEVGRLTRYPEHLFYLALLRAPDPTKLNYHPLRDIATEMWGGPELDVETNALIFTPLAAPHDFYVEDAPVGVRGARRSDYDPRWVLGDISQYRPPRYYTFGQLREGIVLSIGKNPKTRRKYKLTYPHINDWLDGKFENWDPCWEPDGMPYVPGKCFPDANAPVIFTPTDEPITPYETTTDNIGFEVQLFGSPRWVQSPKFPVWEGHAGYNLMSINDNEGDGGTTNILFYAEDCIPNRVWFEWSCT